MIEFHQMKCVPCTAATKRLSAQEIGDRLELLDEWFYVVDPNSITYSISKVFTFKNFKGARAFFNYVADIAEEEGHHPDITIFNWKRVRISLRTHAINGMSENDFVMAAKIDQLFRNKPEEW